MIKHFFAGVLSLVLLFALLPTPALAAEGKVFPVSDVPSLMQARDQASNGDTIRLGNNIDLGTNKFLVDRNRTITLDLNGYTITGAGSYVLGIAGGSTVTVRDTSDAGAGSIIGNTMVINNYGAFNLERGTVRATNKQGYAVYVTDAAALTTSGDIYSDYIGIYTKGSVTINGGTVNSDQYGVYAYGSDSSVTLTDGTVEGDKYGVYACYGAIFNMSGGKVTSGTTGVCIYRGGAHTINDGEIHGEQYAVTVWGYQKLDENGELDENPLTYGETTLTVRGGKISSPGYGISGNGLRNIAKGYSCGGTTINIEKDADIEGTEGMGIYHPQAGNLNIRGGVIKGASGVEMRGGNLTMTGGAVTGNADQITAQHNNNGNSTKGVGIAVCLHHEGQPPNVHISGGTITGHASFFDYRVEGFSPENLAKVKIEITGGRFESTGIASVISQHKGFITGGSYRYGVDEDYLGTCAWDEADGEKPAGFVGTVHCIKGKVEGNDLPYHVGYLTGDPTEMITMREGDTHDPFISLYELNGVKMTGVAGNAIVNVKEDIQDDNVVYVAYMDNGNSGAFLKH